MEKQDAKRVLITGASGFVGNALQQALGEEGYRILKVSRTPKGPDEVGWDLEKETFDLDPTEKIHAAVHLAGESIAGGRWTQKQKDRILKSREIGTRLLCQTLVRLEQKPSVLVSVSGVHYYEDNTGEPQTEEATVGKGFLSKVCQMWEEKTVIARSSGIRVVNLRLGVVLSPKGGALQKMLPAFKFGAGGKLGSGEQMFSWIALEDVVAVVIAAIKDERYEGPINVVAPEVVTNGEFTKTLGRILNRPTFMRVPRFALKGVLGEMADAALLSSMHAVPKRLKELGYNFRRPELEPAMRSMLDR